MAKINETELTEELYTAKKVASRASIDAYGDMNGNVVLGFKDEETAAKWEKILTNAGFKVERPGNPRYIKF